jgi:hypothetical protein
LLGAALLCGGLAAAQENTGVTPPPKVLVIDREYLKPGKGGAPHEKTEGAFVQAARRAKEPTHYIAMNSMSGKNRALFFFGFDSFEAWEKENMSVANNASFSAELDRAAVADGELLSETDAGVFTYNEEQSLRAPVEIAQMRYFEITLYRVRPGHRHEWSEALKLVKAAYERVPNMHWAVYQNMFGGEDATYLVIIPRKSLAELDQVEEMDKQFAAAMGADGMKQLVELEHSAIANTQNNLFQIDAGMSYPRDEWIKAAPEFWKPKGAAPMKMMKAKPEEKPANP